MQVHWTDQNNNNHREAMGNTQRNRMRERHARIRITNKILMLYGLRLNDWNGSKYILSDKKGRSLIVQDLGSLWPAVEKLLGRPIDPLDPSLHDALKQQEA